MAKSNNTTIVLCAGTYLRQQQLRVTIYYCLLPLWAILPLPNKTIPNDTQADE